MTEAEWLACTDPQKMLDFLGGKVSDRKLRLFGCACCRCIWSLLTDERSRNAVVVAEQFADGQANGEQLRAAWAMATTAAKAAMKAASQEGKEARTAKKKAARAAWEAAWGAKETAAFVAREVGEIARTAWPDQLPFFHDIFGNPFRPIAFDSAWRTPEIVAQAQTIYDDRAFERLPMLANALGEAGCQDAEIVGHCRSEGAHVRGCWVVDAILGKT
jgi:hypothetical protein